MTDALAPQAPRSGRRTSRRWVPGLIAVVVAVIIVVVVINLLSGTLFFYNADEAVQQRVELGDDRFTLQCTPVECSITTGTQGYVPVTAFTVAFEGVLVDVVHRGEPAELFQGGTPVVLDGKWVQSAAGVEGFPALAEEDWHYASDEMRIKHDNDYINDDEFEDRLVASESYDDTAGCSA